MDLKLCVHLTELKNVIYQNIWLSGSNVIRFYCLFPRCVCVGVDGERVCVWSCSLILHLSPWRHGPQVWQGEQVGCSFRCCCRVRLCCGSVYEGGGLQRFLFGARKEVCCRKKRWKVYNYLQERVFFFFFSFFLPPTSQGQSGLLLAVETWRIAAEVFYWTVLIFFFRSCVKLSCAPRPAHWAVAAAYWMSFPWSQSALFVLKV